MHVLLQDLEALLKFMHAVKTVTLWNDLCLENCVHRLGVV